VLLRAGKCGADGANLSLRTSNHGNNLVAHTQRCRPTNSEDKMTDLKLTEIPIAKAEMLIRRPVAEVFEAFVDPDVTKRFWFTKSTGRLQPGAHLTWTWEMYDISIEVEVKEIDQNERILIEWGNYGEMTSVEWIFTPYVNDTTYVTITNFGFNGDGDKVTKDALDSKGGFIWVLAGLKALMEHNIELNAIADAFPKGLKKH
jgi:uncharacterized protein YndB with AHSA1/START domain